MPQVVTKKTPISFLLATVCALPFAALISVGVAGLLLNRRPLLNVYLGSIFLLPLVLALSASELVLLTFAWRKGSAGQRALLVVYVLVISAYWLGILASGPW
jgi:hypothetical protein